MDFALLVSAAGRVGADRAAALAIQGAHLLVLADGAGGTTGGADAAELVLSAAGSTILKSPSDCVSLLEGLDRRLTMIGQTTAVIVVVLERQVFGASVGDSAAWLMDRGNVVDLTERQRRKPLLGAGNAQAIGFGPLPGTGRVLVGSDGLFKYVRYERIIELTCTLPLAAVPAALVAAARLPSGSLQDDVAVIVAAP